MKNRFRTAAGILLVFVCMACFLVCCGKDTDVEKATVGDEVTTVSVTEENEKTSGLSWEDFEKLSGEEQISFQNSFENSDEFDEWMSQVQEKETTLPWEKESAKQPSEYTKDEFDKLSGEEQIKFQDEFESPEQFSQWLEEAEATEEHSLPWEKKGAKQPSEYTKAEFDALSTEQQIKFQQTFASSEQFSQWLESAEKTEAESEHKKDPSDYSWEEFEALSAQQQIAFQNSFKSSDEFQKWMQRAQNEEKLYPWEKEGAKQPKDYTWDEFQALSGEEQIVFQRSFEAEDGFDKWLTANKK